MCVVGWWLSNPGVHRKVSRCSGVLAIAVPYLQRNATELELLLLVGWWQAKCVLERPTKLRIILCLKILNQFLLLFTIKVVQLNIDRHTRHDKAMLLVELSATINFVQFFV